MSALHSKQTIADGIHSAVSVTYASSASMAAASGFVAEDIYKLAWVLDTKSLWVLTTFSPANWTLVNSTFDVSASFVTLGATGSLPNERVLTAGPGIAIIDGGAGGAVTVRTTGEGGADVSGSYITLGATGSLPNERVLSASNGIVFTDGGAGNSVNLQLNVTASNGVQITTGSNGGVIFAASTGSLVGTSFTVPREVKNVIVSGSAGHVTMSLSTDPFLWQEHLFKDGDGKAATNNIIISASAGHRIDGGFGHEISSSYGRARVLFVGNGLWSLVD